MIAASEIASRLCNGENVELVCAQARLEDQVLTIVINRPQVNNALDPPGCAEIGQLLEYCESADAIRAVIITGAGKKAFCAGFDLHYAELHPEVYADTTFGSELVRRVDRTKPVIAAVNGLALGFGFELALACDLIIATEGARFGLPEPRVGLAAMAGGVVRLTREIGTKRALGMILTARTVSARQGMELGFVNEVCADSVLACATEWAKDIVKGAPLSITASKEMACRQQDMPSLSDALDPQQYPAVKKLLASEDAREGRRAFLEKRSPVWKGR